MAAEPNPYFDPYLRSATPTGRSGGSAYPTEQQQPQYPQQQQHGYPPAQPGSPYFMGGAGHAAGTSAASSQWDLPPNGYGTPREDHGLLQQQQAAMSQQNLHPHQYYSDSAYGSQAALHPGPPQSHRLDAAPVAVAPAWSNEKSRAAAHFNQKAAPRSNMRRWIIIGVVLLLIIAGVVVGIIVARNKGDDDKKDSGSDKSNSNSTDANGHSKFMLSGGQGSTITLDGGQTMVYNNSFGGNWLFDPAHPFNGGKANSWTPAINETWEWGTHRIYGVNIGGWLQLEAFITPTLFEQTNSNPLDEWTMHGILMQKGRDSAVEYLERHYSSFITEADFAEIVSAGLNWVRLPLPWYSIEVWDGEPFIGEIQWKWFLKAIEWARKYGLRISLDLHGAPGSQNGWNHSGRLMRYPTWLKTPMGVANAERTLNYIRIITQFISQEQYTNVIPLFGIINEPYHIGLNDAPVQSFYMEAYKLIRSITGIGKGPVISIFTQGTTPTVWTQSFAKGADRVALDAHPYWAFADQSLDGPEVFKGRVCKAHAANLNTTWNNIGIVAAGEWSLAINACGKWLNQGMDSPYETKFGNGSCAKWDRYDLWTPETKAGLTDLWRTQMDALTTGSFFWNWKVAPSAESGRIETPFWSYQLGLHEGWIPYDPRLSVGACAAYGITETVPRQPLKPNQIGTDANAVPADLNDYPWPPAAFEDVPNAAALPRYTPTGTIISMPGPTFTDPANPSKTIDSGSGWFNPQDTGGLYVPKASCTYLDAWNAYGSPVPAACA